MKSKLMIASLLLAGACAANLNAQEKTNYYTPKWSDNIFVSVGGGVHAINNDGFNKLAPHFSVSVGKLITPTWGVRAQFNGVLSTCVWITRIGNIIRRTLVVTLMQ